MSAPRKIPARLLAPRWWPTWLGLALLRALILLPIPVALAMGAALGTLFGLLARGRRHVVDVNLRLCLPQLGERERRKLADAHFRDLGRGVVEAALTWWAPDARLASRITIEGREHLEAARATGRGIVILTGHFTTLEIGARAVFLAGGLPFHAMYRPYSNAVMDFFMRGWRAERSGLPAIPREDLRAIARALREGRAVWFAPDQTLKGRERVFAPFFGVPAATITATSRLAAIGRAVVLPYMPERRGARWVLRFSAHFENFPSADDAADTTRVLAAIETGARAALPQYFWLHRRFKRRPPGMERVY